ncbi:OmpA family protein [Apibacter raozihei]|uniref:OmpA family protein n=1 Tax=Apibacter TaxID=1778601 RepID=UPI000FE3A35B|nr:MULTISPECIES: OmpA family protein [Apibacter]
MKNIKLIVSTAAVVLMSAFALAQNTQDKWYVGLGIHATDHTSVDGIFNNYFDTKDYSFSFPFSKVTVARSIAKNLAVDFQASLGNMDNKRLKINDEFFLLAGLGLRFSPLSESNSLKWLDPYVRVGANYHKYSYEGINIDEAHPYTAYNRDYKESRELKGKFKGKDNNFVLNGGAGINFWFTKNIGLNIESQYNWVTTYSRNYADFFQHSASIIFKFGAKKEVIDVPVIVPTIEDRDGDGIPDNEDRCPDTPGLPQFQGCPDTDGDGIPDPDDQCPTIPGPKENNGCPWPDTDGDGVLDKDDACPTIPGPKENNGCPWDVKDVTTKLKNINFEFNSSKLTAESLPLVKDASSMLNDKGFEGKKFYVDGHTDRVGSVAVNNRISKQRAQSVVDELVKEGVAKDRLIARGFGKSELLCTQADINKKKDENGNIMFPDQATCDKENRRVVVLDQETGKKVSITKEVQVKKPASSKRKK